MDYKKKRARGTNFSAQEKSVLLALICEKQSTIENKRTDGVSVSEKIKSWEDITKKFNIQSPNGVLRNTESLKKCYDNLKQDTRKSAAEEKRERLMTGGGIADIKTPKDPNQDLVLSLMNPKTVYGLVNEFDSDHCYTNKEFVTNTEDGLFFEADHTEIVELEEVRDDVNITPQQGELDEQFAANTSTWRNYTPKDLKSQLSTPLRKKITPSRRRPGVQVKALTSSLVADKYNNLLDHRLSFGLLQRKQLEAQIDWEREERMLKRKALELDIRIKEKQLEKLQQ